MNHVRIGGRLGLLWLTTTVAAATLDPTAVSRIVPGAAVPLPTEVFTPAYRQQMLARKEKMLAEGLLARADSYLATSAAVWRERIPVQCAFGYLMPGLVAPAEQFNATCPACGRPARFGKVDVYGGTVTMDCCGAIFAEDPAAYPAGAPGRPTRVMLLRHFDGKLVEYPYYEFPDRIPKNQQWTPWKPADGSPLHEVFLAGGYIRGNRLGEILNKVIPDLGWAYFHTGEPKYAVLLAEILDRLAELYPTWPLWNPYGTYGFALNRAGNGLLTKDEYAAAIRPMRWDTQFWNTFDRSYRFGHMKMGEIMPQYGMGVVANLVKAYAAIRDSEPVKGWAKAKFGDPAAFDHHVMQDLFGETVRLYKCYEPWFGNYTTAYFEGAIFLSLLTRDRYFFDVANELMERSLYDEAYADHTTTQGACSYWGMVYYPLGNAFQLRRGLYDPDVDQRHPRLGYLGADGQELMRQVTSFRWVLPAFGDTWNTFYHKGMKPGTKPANEPAVSTHFPDYGASMLRWGEADGRRQELCLTYQRVAGHTHCDALNLEYFVDGMPVFWDMGYGNGTLDTDLTRNPGLKEIVMANWPRPVFDTGPYYRGGKGQVPTGHWWSAEWNHRTVAHCTVLVDEKEPNPSWEMQSAGLAVTLSPDDGKAPGGRLLEVLDMAQRGVFPNGPAVSEYRRTLLTVVTPGGGGYAVDIFRVTGGRLHEFYYHAISEKASGSLPEGEAQPGTLASYRSVAQAHADQMKEIDHPEILQTITWSNGYRHIRDLRRIATEPPAWNLTWMYDPQLYAPRTAKPRENLAAQLATQKPIALAIHGVREPGSEQQAILWRARGLLTGHLLESLQNGTELNAGWQSNMGFVGGLDMLILERRGDEGMKSVFTHVIEGRRADLPAEVMAVERLPVTDAPEGAVALKVTLNGGVTDYVVALKDEGEVTAGPLSFHGRYGVLRTDAAGKVQRAAMIRGSRFKLNEFALTGVTAYRGQARRFEGDVTGDRRHPAIVLATEQALPSGTALAGQSVQVTTPDGWTDVYFIESIAAAGAGEWRIALKDFPTFILDFLTVGRADDKDEFAFFPLETDLTKASLNAQYGKNTTLIRLSDGREFPVDLLHAAPHPQQRVVLHDRTVPFARSGLNRGDKMVLVRHKPGDQVLIPLRQSFP